jgi:chromosome segregation ATPase
MDENDSKYPNNNGLRKDRQEVMSLLSKSKQVREEMKVSLQLIELNLMNQLESTRNESQMSSSSAPSHSVLEARDVAASFEQKSMQIREEARQSLHKTELDLLQKIAAFEVEVKKNEDAANALKKTCAEQEQAIKEARTKRKLSCSGASKVLLNTLSKEVHTTVGKMREKEEQVNKLNLELDDLRRELDDVVREKDERIEELETQTRQAEEKMKILKGSFSFSDDEASTPAEKIKPSPFFGRETIADYEETSYFQDSPELGSF